MYFRENNIKKLVMAVLSFVTLLILTGCVNSFDDIPILEGEVSGNKVVNIDTEYDEGIIIDREFYTGYKGRHEYNVTIGYKDLAHTVSGDAELYNDYQVGDVVPILLKGYTHEDGENYTKIEYSRDYERHTILQTLKEEAEKE